MDKLSSAMARARALGRAAFIPFLSAGAPSLSATRLFLEALEESADIVELGVPFSDPVADGPVIQEASERALKAGATLDRILDLVAGLKAKGRYRPEILLFSYLNPVLAMGFSTFARRAARAGAAGALLVDLPPEEAGDYLAAARASGLGTVFLASPTTTPERLRLIGKRSTGFVYYVSRLGVTGARASLPAGLGTRLRRVRGLAGKPLAVGFGISTPEQAAQAARHADGVVVGSALVSLSLEHPPKEAARRIGTLARAMKEAMC